MKVSGGSFRAFAVLVCAALTLLGARSAKAETPKRAGFDLLGVVGYGVAISGIADNDPNEFGPLVGADFGYTWRSGFRLGVEVTYGFPHEYKRASGALPGVEPVPLKVWTGSAAGSLGYDLLLGASPLRLRGALDLGATGIFLNVGSVAAILIAPNVAMLWQHGAFEAGLCAKFMTVFNSGAESGLVGELKAGARF